MKRFVLLFLLVLSFVVTGCKKEDKPAMEGNPAPLFTLKDMSGRDVNLADLKGNVVLLNFWATWCPPCREEIPSMMRLNKAMAGKPFRMLAVSINDGGQAEVSQFFKESGADLPALFDPTQSVAKRYGLTGVPETFVIDKKGVIVKKMVGSMNWDDPAAIQFLTDAMLK